MRAFRTRNVILSALFITAWPLCVQADEDAAFEVPTAPEHAPAWWEFEVDVSFLVPVERMMKGSR